MELLARQWPVKTGNISTVVPSPDTVKSREKTAKISTPELPTSMLLPEARSARPRDVTVIDTPPAAVQKELSDIGNDTGDAPSEAQNLLQAQEKKLEESKNGGEFDIVRFTDSSYSQIAQLLSQFLGGMQKSLIQLKESSAQFKIERMKLNNKSLDLQREAAKKDYTAKITQAAVSLAGSALLVGQTVKSQRHAEKQLGQINQQKSEAFGLHDPVLKQETLENLAQHTQRTSMRHGTRMAVMQQLSQVPGQLGQVAAAPGQYEAESLRINSQQLMKEYENVTTLVQDLTTLTDSTNKAIDGLMQGHAQIYQSLAQASRPV